MSVKISARLWTHKKCNWFFLLFPEIFGFNDFGSHGKQFLRDRDESWLEPTLRIIICSKIKNGDLADKNWIILKSKFLESMEISRAFVLLLWQIFHSLHYLIKPRYTSVVIMTIRNNSYNFWLIIFVNCKTINTSGCYRVSQFLLLGPDKTIVVNYYDLFIFKIFLISFFNVL